MQKELIEEGFQQTLLAAKEVCNLTDEDIARQFGCSKETLDRWKRGQNEPHQALRRVILAWLQAKLRQARRHTDVR